MTDEMLDTAKRLCEHLELPHEIATLSYELWADILSLVHRSPIRLLVDCIYVIAFVTGRRRSIRSMRAASLAITGYPVRVLRYDRRENNPRWVQQPLYQEHILSKVPDPEALDLLLKEYESDEEE